MFEYHPPMLISLGVVLTHAEVGHAAVSQYHDEFGLVCPPLLFPSCKQVLHRGERAQDDIRSINISMLHYIISHNLFK